MKLRTRVKEAIAERWLAYRESKRSICKSCMGWGEIGHGSENRDCNSCYGGIIHGETWGQKLDSVVESVLELVGVEVDETW